MEGSCALVMEVARVVKHILHFLRCQLLFQGPLQHAGVTRSGCIVCSLEHTLHHKSRGAAAALRPPMLPPQPPCGQDSLPALENPMGPCRGGIYCPAHQKGHTQDMRAGIKVATNA